jgi:hypothetical protein
MAESSEIAWVPESVPDADRLFMRVHVALVTDGNVRPNVFREHDGAMSTDWEKYSTAEQTRDRGREPSKNGVIALVAGVVRSIEDLEVRHSPDVARANRAHTIILRLELPDGPAAAVRKTRIRKKLCDHFGRWLIRPEQLS